MSRVEKTAWILGSTVLFLVACIWTVRWVVDQHHCQTSDPWGAPPGGRAAACSGHGSAVHVGLALVVLTGLIVIATIALTIRVSTRRGNEAH